MSHSRPSGFIQWLSVLLLVVLLLPLPGAASPLAADTPPDAVDPAVTTGAVLVNAAAERVAVDTPQPVEPAQVEAIASPAAAQGPGVPISLRAGMLDLTRGLLPDVPADLRIDAYPNGERGYYIVQFIGPVQEGWKANVAKAGGVLFDYLPDFAFVVAMDEATRDAVAGMKEVAAIGILQPAYKLNPDLIGVTGVRELVVQTFPGELLDTVRGQAITLGAQVRESTASESGGLLRLSLDTARLADLARIPAVSWIEPFYERVLHNDVARSNTIMAAETAWTNLGLYGAGQVVAVADTGLDTGSTSTLHQDFLGSPTGCSSTGRIIATYALGRTGDWSDSCRTGSVNEGGHGTHVSGSVLGNGCRSGSTGVPNYAGSYAGLAPQAGLVMQSVMDSGCGLGGLPTDLNTLFNQARDAGARIHTNSWGAAVAGQYTTDSRNSDLFLWNNKYQTILFSAGNEGIDNPSSDGYINPDSIGAPGTAKNVITVGASENVRSTGGYNPGGACSTWGGCWPTDYPTEPIKSDRLSDNASGMVAFSSRGPTDDGRIKPDVVAPGSNILSTKSQGAYVSGGWGAGPNQYYQYMGGTSMATPLTAGAMAQIREFYTRIKGITPSGALLKATVINSAVNLSPGQYASPLEQQPILPNNAQGWGRVNVANATDDSHLWQDISDANGLATGGSQSYTYPYCGTAPLKVTLAWTDYPGALAAATELVNDLDLTVTAPDGTTIYRGNIFSNGWSATGGSADRKNPVESVYIQTPTVGNWTVTVSGYNVPNGASGKQGYGLVVDGASTSCAGFTVSVAPTTQSICAPADAAYTVTLVKVGSFTGAVTLSASGNPAGTTATFSANPVTPPGSSTLTIGNTGATAAGTYTIGVTGTSGSLSHSTDVMVNVSTPLAAAPTPTSPADGSTGVATTPTFTWGAVTGGTSYDIQVATDPVFAAVVASATGLTGTSFTPSSALVGDTVYYWRVTAVNGCGSKPSASYAFRTLGGTVCTNVIGNGDFESGRNVSWSESSSAGYEVVDNTSGYARTGSWFAWLGGDDSENSQVWQAPTISASTTSASLTYWYRINSGDYCGYDYGYLKVAGTTRTTYNLCSSNGMTAYAQATYDMLSFKGTSPEVRFQATTDSSYTSSLFIDDVVLNVCTSSTSTTADYSDLTSSYGVAWHAGDGTLRLGPTWTADTAFGSGADTDDGVTFMDSFIAGQNAIVRVNVQGTPTNGRWLKLWFDWNNNGVFDNNERVINAAAVSGDNDLSVPVPAGLTGIVKYRARLYDSAAGTLVLDGIDAISYDGAPGGEVEDGESPQPLAVALAGFTADATGAGVALAWETVSETDNAGFNVYRAESELGPWTRLNAALIPAAVPGASEGHAYTWIDATAAANTAYVYRLEAVALDGTAEILEALGVTYRPARRTWLPLAR